MGVQPTQWQPPASLGVNDRNALIYFQRGLANGECVYPAGSVGRGLYPPEWKPIADRASQAVVQARQSGITGEVLGIVYFPSAASAETFLSEANQGRKAPLRVFKLPGHEGRQDEVMVSFK